jgi:hypothetical protein
MPSAFFLFVAVKTIFRLMSGVFVRKFLRIFMVFLFKSKVVITLQRFVVFWNFPAVLPSKLAAGMA